MIEAGVGPEASCSCDIDIDVGIEGGERIFLRAPISQCCWLLGFLGGLSTLSTSVWNVGLCVSPRMYVGATYNVGQKQQDQRERRETKEQPTQADSLLVIPVEHWKASGTAQT